MRTFLLSLTMLFTAAAAMADQTVSVVVKDAGGPLPGAEITVKEDATIFEVTGADGDAMLTVPDGATLVIASDPLVTQTIKLKPGQKSLTVTLKDSESLEEFVTIGYGRVKAKDKTGSTQTIKEDMLKNSTAPSIDAALQGRVAGVSVTSSSGQPGAAASVRIRGTSSLSGSNDPLYVVDGMPIGGGTDKSASSNPLASINPADIVSMEILKDASATAIYGSRASNGVIMITTRKGKAGDAKFSYDGNFSVSQFTKRYNMMNLREWAEYVNDDYVIRLGRGLTPEPELAYPEVLGEGTDWQDHLFRSAIGHSHQISVNGGSEKTQYNISLGFSDQEGVLTNTDYQRINGRISLDSEVKKWLKMGINIGITRQNMSKAKNIFDPKAGDGASCVTFKETDENIILQTLLSLPSEAPYGLNGEFTGPETNEGAKLNPIATLEQSPLLRQETNILANTYAEVKFSNALSWRTEFGIDITNSNDEYYEPFFKYGALSNNDPTLYAGEYSNTAWRLSSFMNYNKTIKERHNIDAMVGAEAQEFMWEGEVNQGKGFEVNEPHTMNLAKDTKNLNAYTGSGAIASFFGRAAYNYASRYFVTATGRFDGSSNFAPGNRWGFFPSFGLAWRIDNEKFAKDSEKFQEIFSTMKLRLGYGETGNANCAQAHIAYVTKWNHNGEYAGFHYQNYTNNDLTWETNKQTNVAIDLGFLKDRFTLTVDGFYKMNEDLLLKPELPVFVAPSDNGWECIETAYVNAGSIKNVGVDLAIGTVNIDKKIAGRNFMWSTDLSFSLVKNEVVDLGGATTSITEKADKNGVYRILTTDIEVNRSEVGDAPGLFYGYEVLGIVQNQAQADEYNNKPGREKRNASVGDLMFSDSKTVIGDPNPDFTCGLNNTLSYGPWTLGIQLSASYGNDVFNLLRMKLEGMTSPFENLLADCGNFAKVAKDENGSEYVVNPEANIPRPNKSDSNGNCKTVSDRYVEDGSYIKIQNVSLSYSLPETVNKKLHINGLRLSANVQNLYTFTNYSGYDPEISGSALRQGVDEGRYPTPRQYTLGLSFNF
ncbi:MAG: TonB-dependent receptor [Paludibacteraceae bacterium]|nr:TonB-dependent receptor [Paludibacteraceae bacterium]